MKILPVASHVVRWLRKVLFGRMQPRIGGTEVADAKLLADAERAAGLEPERCAWLDTRTIDDVDLPLVFRAIDRTTTPTGAQALWRWLTAPATDRLLLRARERQVAHFECATFRDRLTDALGNVPAVDAQFLPRLLWQPPAAAPRARVPVTWALHPPDSGTWRVWSRAWAETSRRTSRRINSSPRFAGSPITRARRAVPHPGREPALRGARLRRARDRARGRGRARGAIARAAVDAQHIARARGREQLVAGPSGVRVLADLRVTRGYNEAPSIKRMSSASVSMSSTQPRFTR